MPSSTSSSEKTFPGGGLPWAVLLAFGLVALVELAFHLSGPDVPLHYGAGLGSYYEVRHTIEARGPADIAILGSSRGREAVLAPDLRAEVSELAGHQVSVANYSCPDATASDILQIANLLVRGNKMPSLVVYVISPRILRGNENNSMREEIFDVFPNQYGNSSKHILASFSEKPLWDLRNFLGNTYLTFRHRYWIRARLTGFLHRRKISSPIQGEYSAWQQMTSQRSLTNHPLSESHVKSYVGRLLDQNGRYVLGTTRIQALEKTLALCLDNDIPIVLVVAPLSSILKDNLPPSLEPEFRTILHRIQDRWGENAVLDFSEYGLVFRPEDFREQSHLNRRGAATFTRFLVREVIGPTLYPERAQK